jgi:CRP-like cAMP-binding protein
MHKTFSEHWLIKDLPSEAKAALYSLGEVLKVTTDEVIIAADAPNDEMYLLLEGAFKVTLPDRPDRIGGVTLGHRGPGDLLGEYSFVDAFRPAARVTASTPGLVLRIRHEAMRGLLEADSKVSSIVYRNMLSYLVARLRAQDEEIDYLMF